MRLKTRLIGFASIGVLVAFAASDAFAQGTPSGAAGSGTPGATSSPSTSGASKGATGSAGAGGAGQTGSAGASGSAVASGSAGASASQGPWTANNVTAARPFGDINIQAAGTTPDAIRTWSQSRSATERAELQGRCDVIMNPANTSRYDMQAQTFCRNYMMVASADPTGKSGGQLGGSAGASGSAGAGGQAGAGGAGGASKTK